MASDHLKPPADDDMLDEYDFSKGERGKYFHRYWAGRTPIALDPDLVEDFPTSKAVNTALRAYRDLGKTG